MKHRYHQGGPHKLALPHTRQKFRSIRNLEQVRTARFIRHCFGAIGALLCIALLVLIHRALNWTPEHHHVTGVHPRAIGLVVVFPLTFPLTFTDFRPGQIWLDTDGLPIQVHSGAAIVPHRTRPHAQHRHTAAAFCTIRASTTGMENTKMA